MSPGLLVCSFCAKTQRRVGDVADCLRRLGFPSDARLDDWNAAVDELDEIASPGVDDPILRLAALLREAGLVPYLHGPCCATWHGGACDMGCGP